MLAIGALALAACLMTGCAEESVKKARAKPAETAVPVHLAPVAHRPVSMPLRAPGVLAAIDEIDLAFKIGGVVTEVLVNKGGRVRKGQKLATIDVTEVAAEVSKSEQAVEKAERDLARVRSLREQNSVALMEVQNAETGLSVARAVAEAASFNLRHTSILAPADGVINELSVQVGEVVGPGTPAFHLSTRSRGAVARIGVGDRDLLDLKVGTAARLWPIARPERSVSGVVSRLATTASPVTGTYEVEISFHDPGLSKLPTGLVVQVEIERSTPPVTTVPIGALVDADGSEAAVFVVREAHARRVPVTIFAFLDERVLLATGLDEADTVVASGANRLSDGTLVSVLP